MRTRVCVCVYVHVCVCEHKSTLVWRLIYIQN